MTHTAVETLPQVNANDFSNLIDFQAKGYVITPTLNRGVYVAVAVSGAWRLAVCDHVSGWDVTGPAYRTKSEAFANVDRTAAEYYGLRP